MQAGEGRRGPHLERMRTLPLADREVRRSRDTCVRMFDAVARASALQASLEPMADRLDALVDAGLPVPIDQRAEVVRVYREANEATERASRELDPCVHGIDRLRVHTARRR